MLTEGVRTGRGASSEIVSCFDFVSIKEEPSPAELLLKVGTRMHKVGGKIHQYREKSFEDSRRTLSILIEKKRLDLDSFRFR